MDFKLTGTIHRKEVKTDTYLNPNESKLDIHTNNKIAFVSPQLISETGLSRSVLQ